MYEMSRAAKPIDRDGAVAVCLDTTGIEEALLMGTQFLWVGEQDEIYNSGCSKKPFGCTLYKVLLRITYRHISHLFLEPLARLGDELCSFSEGVHDRYRKALFSN